MKKRPFLIVAALGLLGLFALSLLFFSRGSLKVRLAESVRQSFGLTATVGEITWRWLPLPAITVKDLSAEAPGFTLFVPQAEGIVNPTSLLSGKLSLAHVTLSKPQLRVKPTAPGTTPPRPGKQLFSDVGSLVLADRLTIRAGTVSLPPTALDPQHGLQALTLTEVQGSLSHQQSGVTLALTMHSPCAQALEIKGHLDSKTLAYQLDVTGKNFISDQLLSPAPVTPQASPSPADRPPAPLPSLTAEALALHLQGQGDDWQLTLTSQQTPLALSWRDQSLAISSLEGLTISHQRQKLTFDIAGISLAEPHLALKGQVSRRQAADDASLPLWSIDLSGQEVDLTAVRAAILANFGTHPVAQKVCEIVQGGRARSARFAFSGNQSELASLAKMRIWAEADNVPLSLPAVPLQIDAASGPIAIENGQLTGHHLSATIASSQGNNGELLFDLEPDQHGFHLDLDLDVELHTLQEVLAQIVPSPQFHQELARFSQLNGQAQGHLRLGEDLRQVRTEVEVQHFTASGRYDRLPWPFTIKQGALTVLPTGRELAGDAPEGDPLPPQVAWAGVSGQLGAQQIQTTSGLVSWAKDTRLELKELDADLELKSLIEEGAIRGKQPPLSLQALTSGHFDRLSGQLSLQQTTVSGPLQRPKEWQFHSLLRGRELQASQAGFPDLRAPTFTAEISQQQLDFAGDFKLFEQELHGIGHYRHHLFDQWQGQISITGEIDQQLGEWLKERRPTSGIGFLKTPFRVEKFVITTAKAGQEDDDLSIDGTILPLGPEGQARRLRLTNRREGQEQVEAFTFIDGDRQGQLTYRHRPGQEGPSLLSWDGEVASETIDAFFSQPWVRGGTLLGKFSRLADAGHTTYQGTLAATAVHFLDDSLAPELTINALRLRGEDNRFTIDQADLSLADSPLSLSGGLRSEGGLHQLDLRCASPHLAWEPLHRLFDRYRPRETAAEGGKPWTNALRGRVSFALDAFDYPLPPTPPPPEEGQAERPTASAETNRLLTVAPLRGQLDFTPAGMALAVDQGTVCGITGQGKWYFGEQPEEDTLTFSTGQEPLSFAEALPCLRIKQSLILGPFSLHGHLSGRPKAWREGNISLSSTEGIIKRMSLLSKVFTAVNFTDYLTWDDSSASQGEGLPYNDLIVKAHVVNNQLNLDRTFIRGKGVNVSGRGTINLADLDADLTFFIAPFKGLDWLVSNLPLVGKALAGPKESILTFPVAVTGNIKSPEVTALAPTAIGSAVFELFKDTMTLPFRIFDNGAAGGEAEGN